MNKTLFFVIEREETLKKAIEEIKSRGIHSKNRIFDTMFPL